MTIEEVTKIADEMREYLEKECSEKYFVSVSTDDILSPFSGRISITNKCGTGIYDIQKIADKVSEMGYMPCASVESFIVPAGSTAKPAITFYV